MEFSSYSRAATPTISEDGRAAPVNEKSAVSNDSASVFFMNGESSTHLEMKMIFEQQQCAIDLIMDSDDEDDESICSFM